MFFNVIAWNGATLGKPAGAVYLRRDNWDDFGFKTQFFLVYKETEESEHKIGFVKIGRFLENPMLVPASPSVPDSFDSLGGEFYSIGQGEDYYQNLNKLGAATRDRILDGLRDLAKNSADLERAVTERMMEKSLLRDVRLEWIKGRYRRLALGDARLTAYKFSYTAPQINGTEPLALSFEVKPESEPPTNIHVLIGRNGVGKTYLFTKMTLAVVSKENPDADYGTVAADEANEDEGLFANLISVSFSAFDPFDALPVPDPDSEAIDVRYSYIGLKEVDWESKKWRESPKDIRRLTAEFIDSVESCLLNDKFKRLERAVGLLSSDTMFERVGLIETVKAGENLKFFENKERAEKDEQIIEWYAKLASLFGSLSSGHKIVLLTITRLVESVVERTLILIDEPEAHLHPPLLAAFIRSLSDFLIQQNGVAILATHSPVVLQEVPKNCVWKLRRSGAVSRADRPSAETFGENVGVLTRDVFGLEVTESGFHKMLKEAVAEHSDYESVLDHFDEQLGAEARAIVQGLLLTKDEERDVR